MSGPCFSVRTTVGPAAEPLSLSEAKSHLKVEFDFDDTYIGELLKAARDATERESGCRWMPQTVEIAFGGWPPACEPAIELPISPVASVTGVTYVDVDGVEQTLVANDDWQTWLTHQPPLVAPAPGTSWPSVQSGALTPVKLTAIVGYADAATVPAAAKQAIRICLSAWYQGNRGDRDESPQVVAARIGVPSAARNLLALLGRRTYY